MIFNFAEIEHLESRITTQVHGRDRPIQPVAWLRDVCLSGAQDSGILPLHARSAAIVVLFYAFL
jgi:hypothetical protein